MSSQTQLNDCVGLTFHVSVLKGAIIQLETVKTITRDDCAGRRQSPDDAEELLLSLFKTEGFSAVVEGAANGSRDPVLDLEHLDTTVRSVGDDIGFSPLIVKCSADKYSKNVFSS